MKLIDTVEMMNSENYKERFRAEYFQLKIRAEGLEKTQMKRISVFSVQIRFFPLPEKDYSLSATDFDKLSEPVECPFC